MSKLETFKPIETFEQFMELRKTERLFYQPREDIKRMLSSFIETPGVSKITWNALKDVCRDIKAGRYYEQIKSEGE